MQQKYTAQNAWIRKGLKVFHAFLLRDILLWRELTHSLYHLCKKSRVEQIINLSEVNILQGDKTILKQVNLSVQEAEFVYLIGKTGSGKSSLLKTLYGELPIAQGTGMIAGYDLKALKPKEIPFLRRKLGIVFQDFQLLMDRTVIQNLYFVLKATGWKQASARKSQIESVLERVSMEQKLNSFPHRLSGGEQQRVAVARALLNDPDLIIADEPTGNLDPETSHEVMQLFEEIHRNGKSLLVATHNHQLIAHFGHPVVECAQQTLTLK